MLCEIRVYPVVEALAEGDGMTGRLDPSNLRITYVPSQGHDRWLDKYFH